MSTDLWTPLWIAKENHHKPTLVDHWLNTRLDAEHINSLLHLMFTIQLGEDRRKLSFRWVKKFAQGCGSCECNSRDAKKKKSLLNSLAYPPTPSGSGWCCRNLSMETEAGMSAWDFWVFANALSFWDPMSQSKNSYPKGNAFCGYKPHTTSLSVFWALNMLQKVLSKKIDKNCSAESVLAAWINSAEAIT